MVLKKFLLQTIIQFTKLLTVDCPHPGSPQEGYGVNQEITPELIKFVHSLRVWPGIAHSTSLADGSVHSVTWDVKTTSLARC